MRRAADLRRFARAQGALELDGHGRHATLPAIGIPIAGTRPPRDDGRGNLQSAASSTWYIYNSENMLTSSWNQATLSYDPLQRLFQVSGATVVRQLYDGQSLIAEYDNGNSLLRRYVHGPGVDEPLVWYEGTGTSDRRFYHADERGSIVATSNSSGAMLSVNSYDEYGIPGSGNSGRFQYTGQQWLGDIGMYHYRARIYSPTLGRFLQTDPIGYGDGMNIYAYVGNDPVNATDPSGLGGRDRPPTKCTSNCGTTLTGGVLNGQRRPLIRGSRPTLFTDAFGTYGYDASGHMVYVSINAGVFGTNAIFLDNSGFGERFGALGEVTDGSGQAGACPSGPYTQYSFSVNGTLALFLGVQAGTQIGISLPDANTLRGTQLFISAQASGTLGIGGYLGAGVGPSYGHTNGPLPVASHGPFGYAEADLGWGPSVNVSTQGSRSGSSISTGLPIPRLGAGYGIYGGVGAGYGGTLATPPALCGE